MTGFNLSAWAGAHRSLVGFPIAPIFATGGLIVATVLTLLFLPAR